mmetsp:Transcript_36797/g.59664  ORF Transcript_36797/g.59664 Transcript_36797/m.59664 type:complete len:187 (+) Transcript_36797:893-1453(+)
MLKGRYLMSGELEYFKRDFKHSSTLKYHQFSIELKLDSKHGEEDKAFAPFVLNTHAEPILLADAHVLRHDKHDDQFIVKGKSYSNRRHVHQYTLVADNAEERDRWVESLSRFRKSRENAIRNTALVINFMLSYVRTLENRDWEAMEVLKRRYLAKRGGFDRDDDDEEEEEEEEKDGYSQDCHSFII